MTLTSLCKGGKMDYDKIIFYLKREIEDLKEKIDSLQILKASAIECSGSGSTESPVERYIEQIDKLQEEFNAKIDEYFKTYHELMVKINAIDNPELRMILKMRMIEGKTFGEIGDELFIERTTAGKKFRKEIQKWEEKK